MLLLLGFAIVASQNSTNINSGTCRSSGGNVQPVNEAQKSWPWFFPFKLEGQNGALYFGPLTTTKETSLVSYSITANAQIPFTVLWVSQSKSRTTRCPKSSNANGQASLADTNSFDIRNSGTWIFALTAPTLSRDDYVLIYDIDFSVVPMTTPHDTTPPPTTSLPSLSPTLPSNACIDDDGNREMIIAISNHKALTFMKDTQHINTTHLYIFLGPLSFSEDQYIEYSIVQTGLPRGYRFVFYIQQVGGKCPSELAGSFRFDLVPDQTAGNLTLTSVPLGIFTLGLSATGSEKFTDLSEMDIIIESIEISFDDAKRQQHGFHFRPWMAYTIIGGLVACCGLVSCIYGCSAHFRSESEGGFGTYLFASENQLQPDAPLPPNYAGGTNHLAAAPPEYDFETGSQRVSDATTNSISVANCSQSETYLRNSSMEV